MVDVNVDGVPAANEVQGAFNDGQIAQTEEVHFEEAELFNGRGFVLGDDGRVLDGRVGTGLSLHRHVIEHGTLGNHDGGGVNAVLSALIDESLGDVDHVGDVGICLVESAEFRGLGV